MLQNVLNGIMGFELVTLVVILFKLVKSELKDKAIEKKSTEISFEIPNFINAKIFTYEEDSMIAGYQKGSKVFINIFDSSDFENSRTAVHEYIHVWQYKNHRLTYYICKLIEGIRYGSSIIEKQAYIIEDMYGLCKKTYDWDFDDSIIPVIWKSLVDNKWNYDIAYQEACDYCKNNFKPVVLESTIKDAVKKVVLHYESEEIARTKKMIAKELSRIESNTTACYVSLIAVVDSIAINTTGHDIDLVVKNLPQEQWGYFQVERKYIALNKRHILSALKEKNSIYNFDILLDTIYHECRHAWQGDNGWKLGGKNYVSGFDDYEAYREQYCERDARAYARREVASLSLEDKEAIFRRILSTLLYFNNLDK